MLEVAEVRKASTPQNIASEMIIEATLAIGRWRVVGRAAVDVKFELAKNSASVKISRYLPVPVEAARASLVHGERLDLSHRCCGNNIKRTRKSPGQHADVRDAQSHVQ